MSPRVSHRLLFNPRTPLLTTVLLTTVAAGRGSDKLARENIVSRRQSTFLMGLLSNKAPWDTDKDRARR